MMSLKDYYIAVYRNPDIPDDIKKIYTREIRKELQNDEKEENKVSAHFINPDALNRYSYIITKLKDTEAEKAAMEKEMELLSEAMNMLRDNNPKDYNLLTDFFFSDEKVTMEDLAKKYGITRQTVSNRLQRSYEFLRTVIAGLLNE